MSGDFSLENFTELGHMFLSPAFCWDWQLLVVTLQAQRKQVSLVRSRQRSKFQVPHSTDPGEKQRTPKKVKEHTDTHSNFETITIRDQVWDTGKETKKAEPDWKWMHTPRRSSHKVCKTELFLLQRWSENYQQLLVSADRVSRVQTGLIQSSNLFF